MAISPSEPLCLRISRAVARLFPKGRSLIVRSVARAMRCHMPFLARIGPNWFLIDLNERVSRTLYLFGTFEPTIAGLLPKLITPGSIVLDVGANFGYFTVLAARAALREGEGGEAGKVFAFEPDPRNISRLLANIHANSLPNIQHVAAGAFDHAGHITFNLASDGEDNLGSSSIVADGADRCQIQIPIITLDEFAAQHDLQQIGFMKMDIEGAECQALAGAQRLITGRRLGKVLVEVHNMLITSEQAMALKDRFTAVGYQAYLIREGSAVPRHLPDFLQPLTGSAWLDSPNPHILFSVEPIPGVR